MCNATWLLNNRNVLNMNMSRCCPACANLMSASLRAVYHHTEFDWAAAAYRIGIYVKNWPRQYVVYRVHWGVGPIVPWFAVWWSYGGWWWAAQKYQARF